MLPPQHVRQWRLLRYFLATSQPRNLATSQPCNLAASCSLVAASLEPLVGEPLAVDAAAEAGLVMGSGARAVASSSEPRAAEAAEASQRAVDKGVLQAAQ